MDSLEGRSTSGKNKLLAALPSEEQDRLLTQLEPVALCFAEILCE